MKKLNLITVLISLILIISCGQENKKKENSSESSENSNTKGGNLATAMVDYETYIEMRSALLDINPEEFGMTKSESNNQIFGVILDISQGDSVVTISAYQTGDVSVYYSTGMLYMAGVNVERFREMAVEYTNLSQEYIELAEKTDNKNLPESGFVKFYFVTNNGIYSYQNELNSILENESDWGVMIDNGLKIVKAYDEAINK